MSEIKNNESRIWSWIGKLSILVTIVYASTEIYKNLNKVPEHVADCIGNYYKYETATNFLNLFYEKNAYKAALQAEIEGKGSTKEANIDSLVKQIKSDKSSLRKSIFETEYQTLNKYETSVDDYEIFWEFTIRNKGFKTIEEITLEIPINGYFKIIMPNNIEKIGSFKDRIEIGDIKPSYEAKIKIWSDLSYYEYGDFVLESIEKKSRITHKNGWFPVEYPNKVKSSNLDFHFIFIFLLLVALTVVGLYTVYYMGMSKGFSRSNNVEEDVS